MTTGAEMFGDINGFPWGGVTPHESSLCVGEDLGPRKGLKPQCLRRFRSEMKRPAKVVDLAGRLDITGGALVAKRRSVSISRSRPWQSYN